MNIDQPPVDPGAPAFGPNYANLSTSYRAAAQSVPPSYAMNIPMVEQVTHRDVDAKLQLSETRAQVREATLAGKMDLMLDRMVNLSAAVTRYSEEVSGVKSAVRSENIFTRWTLIGTVVAVALGVLGVLVGMQGTMTTANGNLLGALQTGMAMKQASAPVKP